MGRLIFIGLGLSPDYITLRALDLLKSAEEIVTEEYTSMLMDGGLENLKRRIGRDIRVLKREEIENGDAVLDMARNRDVAFLVAGDPLMATTHSEIRTRARREGIPSTVCYGVSIHTAVSSALGLMHYKFGRTVTLPYPEDDYLPTSPYEFMLENNQRGLHTLVLLDIRADEQRYMTIPEAIGVLEKMEEKACGGFIHDALLVCAAARIGSASETVGAGKLCAVKKAEWGPPLHCLVIPGKLHFAEEESLCQTWVE